MIPTLKELYADNDDDRLIKITTTTPYIEGFMSVSEIIILHSDIRILLTMILWDCCYYLFFVDLGTGA